MFADRLKMSFLSQRSGMFEILETFQIWRNLPRETFEIKRTKYAYNGYRWLKIDAAKSLFSGVSINNAVMQFNAGIVASCCQRWSDLGVQQCGD